MKLKPAIAAVSLLALSSFGAGAHPAAKAASTASFASLVNDTFADAWAFNLGSEYFVTGGAMAAQGGAASRVVGGSALAAGSRLLGENGSLLATGAFVPTRAGNVAVLDEAQAELRAARVGPEPETYAVLLAGLGAIGFLVRRRRFD
ncbi:MAG: PEP-CTERM sorting domain-containing protein [Burkholderiaceae bacterium]